MTAAEVARGLNCGYLMVLDLVHSGRIPATKTGGGNGRWNIDPEAFRRFKSKNEKKIRKLKAEYVRLYWGGISHYRLQERVLDDFARRGIACEPRGFAAKTIYESLMEDQRKERTKNA